MTTATTETAATATTTARFVLEGIAAVAIPDNATNDHLSKMLEAIIGDARRHLGG